MGAGEIDGRLEAARRRGWQARGSAPLRRLELHQNGAKTLRQRVVNVARNPVAFLENRLSPLFEQTLVDDAAVIERERRLARRGVEQRVAPAAFALGIVDAGQRDPAERLRRQLQRRHQQRADAGRTIERAYRLRQPDVVAVVADDRRASLLRREQMPTHALARQIERRPVRAVGHQCLAADIRHPQIAGARRFVQQPHPAGMGLRIIDEALDEHPEEATQVGVRDQQVERQLNGVALNRGHALRALAVGPQVLERLPQLNDFRLERFHVAQGHGLRKFGSGHALIMSESPGHRTPPSGRRGHRPFGRCRSDPAGGGRCEAFG